MKKKRKTLLERYAETKKNELNYKERLKEIVRTIDRWLGDDMTTDIMILRILKLSEE